MKLEKHVLLLAGGISKRVGDGLPKQFMLLGGEPLLFHTFNSFLFLNDVKFTLVLNPKFIDYWNNLCSSSGFAIPHDIVEGGPARFHSVKSGLKNIPPNSLVLIHDAARPFASKETIIRVIDIATRKGNAVPAIEVNDSVREVYGPNNKIIDRNRIRVIQTPQAFHSSLIKRAYNQTYNVDFTDDASVLESLGEKINLVAGNPENIKISNPVDLIFGEGIINYNESN
ncbi:MAG: 2-C-methyl-D-erythritol 4-phosphate cytidylyltransferase [Bacteroidetes bacterium]|nr:2-C-methyl-D-erythritol 4-phosphate cytidylyltransferase [Bacteroidota bacterium]MBL6942824.1 2-C-methyl-D-erythritol 4-phosphate cytidylyltransferase [Bacteroidales bacterium]